MLTSTLMASVQRRAAVPSSQVTFQPADFYALMDEELKSKLVPLIQKNMQEYYVYDYPYTIVSGQAIYAIPPRAIATGLRDVQIIPQNNPDAILPLEKLDITDLYSSSGTTGQMLIQKNGFLLKNNSVILYPTPTTTTNILNLEYYMRPNSCVDPAVCARVVGINTATNQVTVASLPSNITTSTLVDLVRSTGGYECMAIDQTITNIAGTVLSFAALPSNLSVGDYICQATQSCVVQIPEELTPLLAQYVVVRILSAQGDQQALAAAEAELAKLEENAQMLIAPRVAGKVKRVVNTRGIGRFV